MTCLQDIGFVANYTKVSDDDMNTNSDNYNMLKAILLAGLWPRVARIEMPAATFNQVQGGTIQRENVASEVKYYDLASNERVFLHPSSTLFSATSFKSPFVAYWARVQTTKPFIRDVSDVCDLRPVDLRSDNNGLGPNLRCLTFRRASQCQSLGRRLGGHRWRA